MPGDDARLPQQQTKERDLPAGLPTTLAPAFQVSTVPTKHDSMAGQLEGRAMSEGKKNQDPVMKEKRSSADKRDQLIRLSESG